MIQIRVYFVCLNIDFFSRKLIILEDRKNDAFGAQNIYAEFVCVKNKASRVKNKALWKDNTC